MPCKIRLLFVVTLFVLLGCASSPAPVPPELLYQGPTAENSPLIIGSREPTWFAADLIAFVASVDVKVISGGRERWDRPIRIESGKRRIGAQFSRGIFLARADLEFSAVDGRSYELRHSSDVSPMGGNSYCDFWIIDAKTQAPVSQLVRAPVSRNSNGDGAIVPIFIPAKK